MLSGHSWMDQPPVIGEITVLIIRLGKSDSQSGESLMFYLFDQRKNEIENSVTIEIPIKGDNGAVYLWTAGMKTPQKVGFYSRKGLELEADVDLVRFPAEIKDNLTRLSVDFSQFLGQNGSYVEYYYSTISMQVLKR